MTAYAKASADTNRRPSPSIWGDCPQALIRSGDIGGYWDEDDFCRGGPITAVTTDASLVDGKYRGFNSSSQTHTYGTAIGGEMVITADANDNLASYIRSATQPFRISSLLGKLWFETRVKVSDITDDKCGMIIGLWDNTACSVVVPLSTANPPIMATTGSFVGFRMPEEDAGAIHAVYDSADASQTTDAEVVVKSTAHQAVASTYVKLGMVFSPDYRGTKIAKLAYYVNGVELYNNTKTIPNATATDFPATVSMGFMFGQRTGGTTSPVTTCDWWKCYQLDA